MSTSAPSSSGSLPAAPPARQGTLVLCLVALYLIWGSTYLGIRWTLEGFPPFLMAGLRYTLAGVLLYSVLRLRGAPAPTTRQWGTGAVTGLLMLTVSNGSVVFAQQWVPSGMAAVVVATTPLWTALFSGLFGQWPGARERWGLALGFCGIVLLNLGGELGGRLLPILVLLLASPSWAFASMWGRRQPQPPDLLMLTSTQMLLGGALLLLFSLALGERMAGVPGARAVGAFFYLVLFGSLVAFSAYGYLLRHARPSVAISYAYVNPVVAMLLGLTLGGERPGRDAYVALGFILASVLLLTRRAPAPPARR